MSELHKMLESYAKYIMKDNDESGESLKLRNSAIAHLEQTITDEIVRNEANRIEALRRKEHEEYLQKERQANLSKRIKEARNAFWIVMVLGLTVGLIGNQFTDIISFCKGEPGSHIFILWTILIIVILSAAVYLVFKHEYLDKAAEIIETFIQEGIKKQ